MKTSIKKINVKYHIDANVGITVCVMTGYIKLGKRRWEEFTVRGISKCRPGDTYDEVRGRRLAGYRAKIKMFKLAERRAKERYCKLMKQADALIAIKDINSICVAEEERKMNLLLKEIMDSDK